MGPQTLFVNTWSVVRGDALPVLRPGPFFCTMKRPVLRPVWQVVR